MITVEFIQKMARYNQWQNQSLYTAADQLNESERRQDRGAFFKSIHGTFCHLLWGDQIWMHRFARTNMPEAAVIPDSADMIDDWDQLKAQRIEFDKTIIGWADELNSDELTGEMSWFSGALSREVTKPKALLITHMFNHQTHHRGQVHAMITATGGRPDDTDLFILK